MIKYDLLIKDKEKRIIDGVEGNVLPNIGHTYTIDSQEYEVTNINHRTFSKTGHLEQGLKIGNPLITLEIKNK